MIDLHRSMGSTLATATEIDIKEEMERLAVMKQINLVNVVALMSATQDAGEKVRSFLARLRGLAGVTVECSKTACDEKVSNANQLIFHALVRGLYSVDIKQEVLSKSPELDLDGTITFVCNNLILTSFHFRHRALAHYR
jgi:hypothetical protein